MLDKKMIIFGTGVDGVRCKNMLFSRYHRKAECFVVNNCQETNFMCGIPILECNKKNIEGTFVLVATKETTYIIIKEQLCGMGLKEFEDFIYYEWMFKSIALFHGNCHLNIIEHYLRSSKKFLNQYSIYPNPRICENDFGEIPAIVLKNVDLWIHEDIQENNAYSYYLSDNYLRKNMKETTIEIVIPHLFGLGKFLFPYSSVNKRNPYISNGKDRNGMFPHADIIIDQCVERGMTAEQIVEFCLDESAMPQRDILNNFEMYMKKIKQREINWDIKIFDFIMNNYRKQKLFYDMGHPTNILLEYISYKVLEKLDIEEKIYTNMKLDDHEVPVYPVIRSVLQLEWKDDKIRESNSAKKIAWEMNTEEYIKEYLFWCYQM